MEKIAILGGAFDPPHKVHVLMAEHAINELGFDKVVFLPSFNPPHKKLLSSSGDRLDMLKLVLNNPKFEISQIEISANKIGYTSDTIPKLKAVYGDDISYIIGGDSMINLHTWHKFEEVLKQVEIVVCVRNGCEDEVKSAIELITSENRGITVLDYKPQSMSSSTCRLNLHLGLDCSYWLEDSVAEYIKNNNLYSDYEQLRRKLKASIKEKLYNHSINTVRFAMTLNKKAELAYNEVFLASILHDSAKNCDDFARFDIPKDSLTTPVAHAFAGARVAKDEYGVTDKQILDAIYYHTTARANMTKLDKLIFCSDMLEQSRVFDGVDELRNITEDNLDVGFKMCLQATYQHLIKKNADMYPLTKEAYNYYIDNRN